MPTHRFQVYGLHVESPWPFPATATPSGGTPDVRVHAVEAASLEAVEGAWQGTGDAAWQTLPDGAHLLRWPGLLLARVAADGTRIDAAPLAQEAEAALAGYLYAQLLSFPLVARGVEPYHATAVAFPGGAVALLGPPGTGKSTLAAALLAMGGALVTDDLLVVEHTSATALPGPGRIKLQPDAAERFLGLPPGAGQTLHPAVAKRAYTPAAVVRRGVPLRAWVTLGERVEEADGVLGRQRGAAALRALLAGTFNRVVADEGRLRRQFAAAVAAAGVPVWAGRAPRGVARLAPFAERLVGLTTGGGRG